MSGGPAPEDASTRVAFSLTHTLVNVAARSGSSLDVDDLHAALGLSLMLCAPTGQEGVSTWSGYGRDLCLVDGARLFGLRIRDVHPPPAAVGLDHAAAFRQHFDASYRPLVERALEHQQAVLAWRGWPGDAANAWGLITQSCDDGIGLAGVVSPGGGANDNATPVALAKPPVQLYVVEHVDRVTPEPGELVALAVAHARRVLVHEAHTSWGVITGPAAYEAWIGRLETTGENADPPSAHRSLAASAIAGHESALRFLRRHERANVGPAVAPCMSALAPLCEQTIAALATFADAVTVLQPPATAAQHLAVARDVTLAMRDALGQAGVAG